MCAVRGGAQLAAVAAVGKGPPKGRDQQKTTARSSPFSSRPKRGYTARSIGGTMTCPACKSHETRVTDTRHVATGQRRRRECESCGRRFMTYEVHRPRPAERQEVAA